jgi:hypothetical protein
MSLGLPIAIMADVRYMREAAMCESASNLDPWRNRCNALHSNNFREKEGGHGWTPIEHARNKQFRFCFNDLVLNRSGVQVGRRFTARRPTMAIAVSCGSALSQPSISATCGSSFHGMRTRFL